MSKKTLRTTLKDFSHKPGQLIDLAEAEFLPLPPPYDKWDEEPKIKALSEERQKQLECDLDGISAFKFPRPGTAEEKQKLIGQFLSGLKKLFETENNWTFQQVLFLSM